MNRLAESTSPYLRQHAHNPVDWYEWGPEALARAKAEDKPILLSVGYSACHWCHVMAHESFEDEAIAALMNEHFINIKVDREERPDIDAIYQKVVALMGQGGGWPLTVFLTPDQQPFYGGTYFPADDRYGRPGFSRLLQALAQLWKERRGEALDQAQAFMGGFADIAAGLDEDAAVGVDLRLSSRESLAEASRRLLGQIDPEWGGFGRAPKFPNVPSLELMLRAIPAGLDTDGTLAEALRSTLQAMWRGGIYDHLRGGFARYSVDREWLIPHFEKMLYDNALLLGLYADASVVLDGAPHLRRVVEETAAYLLADMRDGRGLFYSATDADSEGVEGKYFCWTPTQLEDALGEQLGRTFARAHGVTEAGNFEHGMSVLHRPLELPPALDHELAAARARLLELRYGRVPPLRDEKVLTAWNALTITGFCKAANAAERWGVPERAVEWTDVAQRACAALLERHRDADGRLLRASWQGRGHTRAYLEDVALLARACLDLHERTLELRWHEEAEALARECLDHYARAGGGFFDTADDGEQLIERIESQHDSPLPSGVAVAIEVLARLELGGPAGAGGVPEQARTHVEQTLSRFHKAAARPFAFAGLITAAQWASERAAHVTIRAASPEAGQALAAAVRKARATLSAPVAIAYTSSLVGPDALVCRAQACTMPIADASVLIDALR
ncbi:MAG TPA: thioredoxin domain-containing protein [Enhygromyxa sp.]|nr:thioredoxin domain-containing protein [Enhygromyxa sp.]